MSWHFVRVFHSHEDHLGNTIHVPRDGEEALAFLRVVNCEAGVNGGEWQCLG